MIEFDFRKEFEFLKNASAEKRVKSQQKALDLLLENHRDPAQSDAALQDDRLYQQLRSLLSDATSIFPLSEVQQEIYYNDSGTAAVPPFLKKHLLNLSAHLVVRPGTLSDLEIFAAFAWKRHLHYSIRASGSWPFGGAIPMNNEVILDLSYLNFHQLNSEKAQLTVGPGTIFADMRKYLKEAGFALRQEITNPNSGTICGWVVTGGLGIGAYKYGPVQQSVEAIFLLRPDGTWQTLTPESPLFKTIFDSEGQIGIVAGVVLKVRAENYITKPYAFSFSSCKDMGKFAALLEKWQLNPVSAIYFDPNYIRTTAHIRQERHQKDLQAALKLEDDLRIIRERQALETSHKLADLTHVLVMAFDTQEDYEKALKYTFFNAPEGKNRYRDIPFQRLTVDVAHMLWKHRHAPVEMKSHGPSMLVSETILPLAKLPEYMNLIQSGITNWTDNPVKNEGHLLRNGEILIQSILLADMATYRHRIYLGLVPFMTQAAIFFGGRAYGTGIWNLPFLKGSTPNTPDNHIQLLRRTKEVLDPRGIINQCKYINRNGRKLALRGFKRISAPLFNMGISLLKRGREEKEAFSIYFLGKLLWRLNKFAFPTIVPPDLKAQRPSLAKINSACAECDSCEKVCPTSDVFGMWGLATPITRRKTANRIVQGIEIPQEEALGFLACTRCDNCTRVCPTDIPLTDMFDMVEANPTFQKSLGLTAKEKESFVDRMWEVMKESPLYIPHTKALQKEERSHLEHGLDIRYPRGYAYSRLFIDEETCINCGMCAHENACMYGARNGNPREMPELLDENCALCNACINFCPQNKAVQEERDYVQALIANAVDREEKKYWEVQKTFLRDTTTIQRSPELTDMADIYITEEILMEIDKEASSGKIPVSGMGQGDRHAGIGFDAERFSHFHIVGPAQNRLHEGDPDEELSIALGKRHRYCKFDSAGELYNPEYPKLRLKSPMLYNSVRLQSNGRVELAFIKVAEQQHSMVVIKLNRILEHYDFFIEKGRYQKLPPVVIPRVDHEMIDHLRITPNLRRELLLDLWNMPMFEVTLHQDMEQTVQFIKASTAVLYSRIPLIAGYVEISEYDIVAGEMLPEFQDKIEAFMKLDVDVIHVHGLRNKDQYFVTSEAVRTIHHYLLSSGRRHQVSLIASGGIRLASDSQKTIQRGAEATLLDIAALLALDPYAYKATQENKTTTETLIHLDIQHAVKRLNHQIESRKIQILEVLGASGFKDIKKTVGEEGRLIDFYELEERIQKDIFEDETNINAARTLNKALMKAEPLPEKASPTYRELKSRLQNVGLPHSLYDLGEVNQTVYQRDHVWPGKLLQTIGRMASGDPNMAYLKHVNGVGLLGDGFDVMKILYQQDPDIIQEAQLDTISTALPLDKALVLQAPWMFGGKSVGSIGLDTWRAHVIAVRELGIQYDTGEGGYPTSFFLNRKGEPIFFSEPDIQLMKHHFQHDQYYTIQQIKAILKQQDITPATHSHIYQILQQYPDLQPFLFYEVISEADEPYISTELKTGLFGVTKETIRKTRRVVIAYSQGAKMGIGGHILAGKVNRLVSYLRGIEGLKTLDIAKMLNLIERIEVIEKNPRHPLQEVARSVYPHLLKSHDDQTIYPELQTALWEIQQKAYELKQSSKMDPLEFEHLLRLCEEIINDSYTSVISPFPFHNCYSIEDVKAFIDMVRMINPEAVISIKVSPSVDIEFIATGLGRIAKDNTAEVLKDKITAANTDTLQLSGELAEYAQKYGMKIEIWLDGPRGGTGASPNIIKGQMGMHIEYAIPLIHHRLIKDGLRNQVKFMVSGGIRTYEDVIKAVALGADGIIWGTAPLVAVGCDRNRNCHDGCSRGIATSNLIMQNLRNVDLNAQQMINTFLIMQMQVIRALAGLGLTDIRELRGRYDKVLWIGLKERVDFRIRQRHEHAQHTAAVRQPKTLHPTAQSNCGVAAVIGSHRVPSYILDEALAAMKNRGMDGVGVGKTLCFPEFPNDYAYRLMIKGRLQTEVEAPGREQHHISETTLRQQARADLLSYRYKLADIIRKIFLLPYFDIHGPTDLKAIRESYKKDSAGRERDYREFGNPNTDPGDIFRFFVRVKKEVLHHFISQELLVKERFNYIREYFPEVTLENYDDFPRFLNKAEDLFVFNHSVMLTQILYVWHIQPENWAAFIRQEASFEEFLTIFTREDPFSEQNIDNHGESALYLLRNFIQKFPCNDFKEAYQPRIRRLAAVMSCGKNIAVWKTAGREIPWETPAAPNNIIHVRLATGSVVEQMNAHPFGKLHTALTHNGETTNYETLKQRVEQFGLPPLASTDTEVAALKFHLLAEELEYPDWALFESFSPTTGDDLTLIPPELREKLEAVQRVEFTSSPDGPYQYLCLRHQPEKGVTERIDLKDPADLRPGTTALWYDPAEKTAFSIIASEEQACRRVLDLLDKEGIVSGNEPDQVLVSNGMINRFSYNTRSEIQDFQFIDRYGRPIIPENPGKHYSYRKTALSDPPHSTALQEQMRQNQERLNDWIKENLAQWDFNTYRWILSRSIRDPQQNTALSTIKHLTWLIDHLRALKTGDKARSSLIDITRSILYEFLDQLSGQFPENWQRISKTAPDIPQCTAPDAQTLLVDASGFEPEGIDPRLSLAALLSSAYDFGWRTFILYRVNGQRLISTAVMGNGHTNDVEMDVYGTPGEYFGAFMQGGTIRCHGNAQNFTAMGIHHGNLYIYGNAGKVCGYAAKGGKIVILGDIVDRAWTNSVNDPRCQALQTLILGSASKYAGESLMGGDFFFGGLYFDSTGQLRLQERPYRGTKLMGGASRGRMLFFDPLQRLLPSQYVHGKFVELTPENWPYWQNLVQETLELAGVEIYRRNEQETFIADNSEYALEPRHFRLLIPKGELKGYDSH